MNREKRDELDKAVMSAIKRGGSTGVDIQALVAQRFPDESTKRSWSRDVDRSCQRLRNAKKIEFYRKQWSVLVG